MTKNAAVFIALGKLTNYPEVEATEAEQAEAILIEARRSVTRPSFALKISHAISYLRDRDGYRKTPCIAFAQRGFLVEGRKCRGSRALSLSRNR